MVPTLVLNHEKIKQVFLLSSVVHISKEATTSYVFTALAPETEDKVKVTVGSERIGLAFSQNTPYTKEERDVISDVFMDTLNDAIPTLGMLSLKGNEFTIVEAELELNKALNSIVHSVVFTSSHDEAGTFQLQTVLSNTLSRSTKVAGNTDFDNYHDEEDKKAINTFALSQVDAIKQIDELLAKPQEEA